jgi:signal peptidase
MQNNNADKSFLRKILVAAGKLFSAAIFLILFIVIALLVYYFFASRVAKSRGQDFNPRFSLFTIISGSMEPDIKRYDVIFNVRVDDPSTIEIGDIITFISTSTISRDMIVTHRVLDIRVVDGRREFITKGDNNPSADGAPVREENLIGKVAFKIPQLGRVQYFLSNWYGWLIVVLIPAICIITYDVIKLTRIIGVKKVSDKLGMVGEQPDSATKKEEDKKISAIFEELKKPPEIPEEIPDESLLNEEEILEDLKALALLQDQTKYSSSDEDEETPEGEDPIPSEELKIELVEEPVAAEPSGDFFEEAEEITAPKPILEEERNFDEENGEEAVIESRLVDTLRDIKVLTETFIGREKKEEDDPMPEGEPYKFFGDGQSLTEEKDIEKEIEETKNRIENIVSREKLHMERNQQQRNKEQPEREPFSQRKKKKKSNNNQNKNDNQQKRNNQQKNYRGKERKNTQYKHKQNNQNKNNNRPNNSNKKQHYKNKQNKGQNR